MSLCKKFRCDSIDSNIHIHCTNNSIKMYQKSNIIDKRSGMKPIESNNTKKHRIFDIFSFSDEVGTLEIRLNEYYKLVDKFIIIESDETFSGKNRELVFPKIKNIKAFKLFESLIVYSICHYPNSLNVKANDFANSIWKREYHMRNVCMRESIKELEIKNHDILIVGDIDEIISHEGLGYNLLII